MQGIGVEIAAIFLLVMANGVFAMAEIALVSARKALLQRRVEEGDFKASAALELAESPSRFLSTVQVGITLVGVLAGAFGGATVAKELERELAQFSMLAGHSGPISVGVVVVGITFLSVVFGELVPKHLALRNAEGIAALMARPMQMLSTAAYPVVRLLGFSTELVLRALGIKPSQTPTVTEEEIRVMIRHGTRSGVFEPAEHEILERVFSLDDRAINVLMTPHPEIDWLDVNLPKEEVFRRAASSGHSRLPVADGSLEAILGIVQVKDLFLGDPCAVPPNLESVLKPALMVPEGISALRLLERFKEKKSHLALVIDEYGGVQGLVTINDILEAIVGNLPSLDEPERPESVKREDGSWLFDGMLSMEEVRRILQIRDLPGDAHRGYHTLGGFVMHSLGRLPFPGAKFEWRGYRFEVLDMDGRRVDKVLVTPPPSEHPGESRS